MNYLLLFLTDGIMGFVLQSIGYVLCVYAFNKRPIVLSVEIKQLLFTILPFAVIMAVLRNIDAINWGFHIVLNMIAIILLSLSILKMQIYSTVLASLVATIIILLSEAICFSILTILLGENLKFDITLFDAITKGKEALSTYNFKAIAGIPSNLLTAIVMFTMYRIFTKKVRRTRGNGKAGKEISK